ncbi:MAG: thymidine phosphorylase [Alphaproteobacteria bacterium]|nr:thymidine phosphorylase [Alphaproteobacteria bacterium]
MLPQEIIRKVRNRDKLTAEEIYFFINGMSKGEIADIQAASFSMAVFLNGLSEEETLALTCAMRDSGEQITWQDMDKGPIVDKHSTGGVGDKVSLMLAPMLAACGAFVPMIAGRGLGHTGGTLDKLEAIAGYTTTVDTQKFKQVVQKIGCAIIGQTADLAPADKKLYAIRDVCATVESIPLITASILAKKLAAGLQYLVMDIKCGNGAFMENKQSAIALAHSIARVANGAGTKTSALLTDMNSVLGSTVGNALEVKEAIDYLQGNKLNPRLNEVTMALCAELLTNSKVASSKAEAEQQLQHALSSGKAYQKFVEMAVSLGADKEIVENYVKSAPIAKYTKAVYAQQEGYVATIDTRTVGLGVIMLGGGRTTPEQKINYTTGFSEFCQIGDKVDKKTPLCYIHAEDEAIIKPVADMIHQAVKINPQPPKQTPVIIQKIA